MRLVYVDSSTLLKRVIQEPGATVTRARLAELAATDHLVSSSLAWVEVSRALHRAAAAATVSGEALDVALSGVDERPITSDVVALAKRIGPDSLRSLDAIHLATAVLLDADVLITHDDRLADAARHASLHVESP